MGERKLDCPGGVAELPPANLKGIQVLIAPAERELQGRVEFGQNRLSSNRQSANYRRRHAAEVGRLAEPHPLSAWFPLAQPITTRPTASNMPIQHPEWTALHLAHRHGGGRSLR
jgi:hypothetical protein